MIFNNNYDKSLYLILNNDNKNKDLILELINDIPAYFLKTIKPEINEDYKIYRFEYLDNNNKNIYTCTKDGNNTLYISRLSNKTGVYFTDITLELKPINQIDLSQMYIPEFLATIKYDYKYTNGAYTSECIEINYHITKTNSGNRLDISSSKKHKTKVKIKY